MTMSPRLSPLLIVASFALAAPALAAEAPPAAGAPRTRPAAVYPYELHDALFAEYVGEDGFVRYADLAHEPRFRRLVEEIHEQSLEGATERQRFAFWINAYNVLVMEGVLRHYPVDSVEDIRWFHGFFKREPFRAAGRDLVLDDIEHGILRAEYHEPRIHFALVCGAASCPPLRREAYRPERLDEQLEDQGRRFLGNPAKNSLDREEEVLNLSSIFKWFGEDFTGDEGELPRVVSRWLPAEAADWVRAHPDIEIEFLDYDWSLNDATGRGGAATR